MKEQIKIAIDGPAAAGKSTVAKNVARKLDYIYIDTGAMYRALTLKALEANISLDNEELLADLLIHTEIKLSQSEEGQKVIANGQDVTADIRSIRVTNQVSYVAKHPAVREEMVKRQQILAAENGVVMDGRDIGTYVLPDAEVKIFLLATVEERARRRHMENVNKGYASNMDDLRKEIEQRDQIDSKRDTAPLIKAEDAVEVDTTALSIQEVTERILNEIQRVIN